MSESASVLSLAVFNTLPHADCMGWLLRCCASQRWVQDMAQRRPYASVDALLAASHDIEQSLDEEDWLEAFAGHPRIGDLESLKSRFASTAALAESEQGAVKQASEETLKALQQANLDYEAHNGFIFIICASGKRADEMLAALQTRLHNPRAVELQNAAVEQSKITALRLTRGLVVPQPATAPHSAPHTVQPSPITTHVLDTHRGRPAAGIPVTLERFSGESWLTLAQAETDADGRIRDWLKGQPRETGRYRLTFATEAYFEAQGLACFYPQVQIEFRLDQPDHHYHVPLLISAHAYSTYRGS